MAVFGALVWHSKKKEERRQFGLGEATRWSYNLGNTSRFKTAGKSKTMKNEKQLKVGSLVKIKPWAAEMAGLYGVVCSIVFYQLHRESTLDKARYLTHFQNGTKRVVRRVEFEVIE